MKKSIVIILALVMVFSMFAGCSEKAAAATTETTTATTETVAVSSSAHVAKNPFDGDKVKIAYVPHTGSSANAQAWEKGIRSVLEPLNKIYGTFEFNVFDPNGDSAAQISILSDLVTQGYDAVIIQCVESSGIVPSILECEDIGMQVISLNISPQCQHAARFGFGGYTNGYAEGLVAAEKLGGKGNVVIIGVPPEVTQMVGDCPWIGFQDALKSYEGITILEEQAGGFTAESGNEIMRDFLTKYDKIDLAWCSNDSMAEGAALAIQSAGRTGIAVWGSDGESQALDYVESGLMTGTLFNNPTSMGHDAAQTALYCIMSTIDQNQQIDGYAPSIMLAGTIVTADNVADITADMRW